MSKADDNLWTTGSIHQIRCKRTGQGLAIREGGGACVCPSISECRMQTEEGNRAEGDLLKSRTADFEELLEASEQFAILILRKTDSNSAAFGQAQERLRDAIAKIKAWRP